MLELATRLCEFTPNSLDSQLLATRSTGSLMQIFDAANPEDWPRLYYNRASDLCGEAKWTLGAVYALILLGALLFYYAQAITDKDFALPDLRTRTAIAQKKLNDVYEKGAKDTDALKKKQLLVNTAIGHPPGFTYTVVPSDGPEVQLDSNDHIDNNTVADGLETLVKDKIDDADVDFHYPSYLVGFNLFFKANAGQIKAAAQAIRAAPKFFVDGLIAEQKKVSALTDDQIKEKAVLNALLNEQTRIDAGLASDSDRSSKNELSISYLVQTTAIRFGGLAIITFVVMILLSHYRYNMKLASYYIGRGDALKLLEDGKSTLGFVELATALTPIIEFGKMPQTPIDQIIELVRAAASKDKERG